MSSNSTRPCPQSSQQALAYFRCNRCTSEFTTQQSLDIHKIQAHISKRERTCDECHKVFISRKGLASHKRVHKGPTGRRTDSGQSRKATKMAERSVKSTHHAQPSSLTAASSNGTITENNASGRYPRRTLSSPSAHQQQTIWTGNAVENSVMGDRLVIDNLCNFDQVLPENGNDYWSSFQEEGSSVQDLNQNQEILPGNEVLTFMTNEELKRSHC